MFFSLLKLKKKQRLLFISETIYSSILPVVSWKKENTLFSTIMHWTIILLLTTCIITVHSQTWSGTCIVNSTCDTTYCCFLSNQIILTILSSNTLGFNTSLNGALWLGQTSYSNQITYPTGYTSTISVSFITLTFTLSSDSSTLTITSSLVSSCSTKAVREVIVIETTTVHSDAG
jgi:hypothetical protein